MKSIMSAIGKFIYCSESRDCVAEVIERVPLQYETHSIATGQTFITESDAESITLEMDGKRYHMDVSIGELPQVRAGAKIQVRAKSEISLGFIPYDSYTMSIGGQDTPAPLYPCME